MASTCQHAYHGATRGCTAHPRRGRICSGALPNICCVFDISAVIISALESDPPPQARVAEIRALTDTLQNAGLGGNKRTFQLLPRHLRRRTMSHNPRRIPRRLRAAAMREIDADPNLKVKVDMHATRHRAHQRRIMRRRLQFSAQRARTHVWLETHLWHTKRMHMRNAWGYRVAASPHGRGERAAVRAGHHLCAIQDLSFHQAMAITGPVARIGRMFALLTATTTLGATASAARVDSDTGYSLYDYVYVVLLFGCSGSIFRSTCCMNG